MKIEAKILDGAKAVLLTDSVYDLAYFKEVLGGTKVKNRNAITFKRKAGVLLLKHDDRVTIEPEYRTILEAERARALTAFRMITRLKDLYESGDVPFKYDLAPSSFPPMKHQRVMFNMIRYAPFGALLADPGTGKTASYLWGIDAKKKDGWKGRALIITLKGLCKNVLKEMKSVTPNLSGVFMNGTAHADRVINKKFTRASLNIDYDVYMASYESMRHLLKVIPEGFFDMIILDEAHRISAYDSKQTEAIVSMEASYKFIASGTIHGNNEMSFYMPYYFMAPYMTGFAAYKAFRRTIMFAIDDKERIWKPSGRARSSVIKLTTPYSVHFNKRDCVDDLPDVTEIEVEVELSKEQLDICNGIYEDNIATIESMCLRCSKREGCPGLCIEDTVMVDHILTMDRKLAQVANGYFVKTMKKLDDNGKEVDDSATILMKDNPRIEALCDILETIPKSEKVIVWSIETRATENLVATLRKKGYKVAACYGNIEAFSAEQKFRESDDQIIVANPTKMGTGLNMQYVLYQVAFFIDHSYVKYDQMVSRSWRKGAKNAITVYIIKSNNCGADDRVVGCVLNKRGMAEELQSGARLVIKSGKR